MLDRARRSWRNASTDAGMALMWLPQLNDRRLPCARGIAGRPRASAPPSKRSRRSAVCARPGDFVKGGGRSVMTVRLESLAFTSGDGETSVPSYLATPDRHGPHPV